MANISRSERVRTLKEGLIILNHGSSTFDCTIRNLSETGARVRLENTMSLPDEFVLRISKETFHVCAVRWRSLNELGVHFIGKPPALIRYMK